MEHPVQWEVDPINDIYKRIKECEENINRLYLFVVVLFIFALCLMLVPGAKGQEFSIATGGSFYAGFGNISIGPRILFDGNISHNETIATASYSPIESHIRFGIGSAYDYSVRDSFWIKRFGLTGEYTKSGYFTKISKHSDFVRAGVAIRSKFLDSPATYYFEYLREIRNGIAKDGTETNRLQGGSFEYDTNYSTHIRLIQKISVATFLDQGNQFCDGSFGPPVACPRSRNASLGAETSILYQW